MAAREDEKQLKQEEWLEAERRAQEIAEVERLVSELVVGLDVLEELEAQVEQLVRVALEFRGKAETLLKWVVRLAWARQEE